MEQERPLQHPPGSVSDSRSLRERLSSSLAKLERLSAGEDVPEAVRAELASLQGLRGELETLLKHRTLSLSHLAAGLAHEINNPLAYTTGNLEYLQQRLNSHPLPASLADECQQVLDEALEGAQHIHRVVADLRALSMGDTGVERPVDLQSVLERTLRMAASQLRHRARVVRAYAPDVPRVLGTETKLGQVALNLVLNAVQALPEGRTSEHQLTLGLREEERGVVLSITDTGPGIPTEVLPHIFDPFFTTRNEGMGMGLAICRDIVTAMGGAIRVLSTPGHGTTVEITLRRAQPARPPEAPQPERPSPRRRIEHAATACAPEPPAPRGW
ncbi:Sensory box histidine kinase/response regulator [Myxococcus hansupus]|uniref:histidine kinase n=1 Tax=Pseudomyxococcus hansupus TaxID=1297742 RepID=A0A0H4XGR2_9BACT|nr:HAMP domain-containing sensor histidine kinase [Myxococcus hansupus]AKQ67427.1 Sensory box histidine kinase/response regulator [Myxococcus hansupus]